MPHFLVAARSDLQTHTVRGRCPCVPAQRTHLKILLRGVNSLRRWRWCSFCAAGDAKHVEQKANQSKQAEQEQAKEQKDRSVLEWLDELRLGYRAKFKGAFHKVGLESLSDLRDADDDEVEELKAELQAEGAKV